MGKRRTKNEILGIPAEGGPAARRPVFFGRGGGEIRQENGGELCRGRMIQMERFRGVRPRFRHKSLLKTFFLNVFSFFSQL